MLPKIKSYKILEEIGRGGMATVYKAKQRSLSRFVALKVLPPYFAHDEELLARFRHEALAVAKLRHPHIVQVFDFHQEEEWFYLAMEYVSGGSLLDRLSVAKRLPVAETIKLSIEVAQGLHHAHEKGFIHRDIKPSNILLSEEGEAVITDFGIVKALEGSRMTQSAGGGIGTSEYMSPEQSQGGKIDRRSDLYSLGIVIYEMLTGAPPFVGESPLTVMYKQIHDQPPPPSTLNGDIGPELDSVIMKLLAKKADDRFATAQEAAAVLAKLEVRAEAGAPADDGQIAEKDQRGSRTLLRRETRLAKNQVKARAARDRKAVLDPAAIFQDRASVAAGDQRREPEASGGPSVKTASPSPARRRGAVVALVALLLAGAGASGFFLGERYLFPSTTRIVKVETEARPRSKPLAAAVKERAEIIEFTGLEIKPEATTITVGESARLQAEKLYDGGKNKETTAAWSVSDQAVVRIDGEGLLTALAPGEAVITAAIGAVRATARCRVLAPPAPEAPAPAVEPAPVSRKRPARRSAEQAPPPPQQDAGVPLAIE